MLLSIITVNYNDGSSLRKTVESVLRFKEANNICLEHLVVDGGSTDESLSLLKSFDLPHLRFVSEKDRGIYDAMNKGAKMAQGQFLIFVNSGDLLLNKKIHDLIPMLSSVTADERLAGVSFDVKYIIILLLLLQLILIE
jgi:glycosyltransferase involved in cell wall biosynthesis